MLDCPNGIHADVSTTPSAPTDDIALALLAGKGDTAAYELLYKRHSRRTYSICLRMLRNDMDAEDLNQEVWVQIYRKIGSFHGDSAFTTWIHRLAVNQVLMHFRKNNVRLEHVTDNEEDFPIVIAPGTEKPNQMSINTKIALDEALTFLAEGYRQVLYYHDVLGYEHEEIAVIMGCSVGTSKSQLHKARLKMIRLLKRKKPLASSSGNIIEKRWHKKLGIELPALNSGDWQRAIDAAAEEELEAYDEELTIGEEWSL